MRAAIDEGKNIMANEIDVNFDYIPHERYIIEIKDKESGRTCYTKRMETLRYAVNAADEYNSMAGLTARILDTKTGEVI